jgi:F-type H+-transporting ATPase subunit delta
MAELVTVARPYAEAIFKAASERKELQAVADGLALSAVIASDGAMRSVLMNPKVPVAQKRELFFGVAGDKAGELVRNLVGMLVDLHREALLPAVSELFEELKRESERVVHARITSAKALDEQQRADIVGALEKQYGRKVEAETDVDPELLGGARVQVGDQVIHASVRDALDQMAAALAP